MGLVTLCLRNPAFLGAIVLAAVLAGIYSMMTLPIQLFPDIDKPRISVTTEWRSASPEEVEAEILQKQEEVLEGLQGAQDMKAYANAGGAQIDLTFGLHTDMHRALLDVISRVNRAGTLPADAEPPVIQLGGRQNGSSNDTLIFYFAQKLPGTEGKVEDFVPFIRDDVIPRIRAVPGVAGVIVNNGESDFLEIQVVFDPYLAAKYGITIPAIANLVGRAKDISAGFVDAGRRSYTMRFKGRFTPEELRELVLDWRDGKPVKLGDIAEVSITQPRSFSYAFQNGNPAIGLRILREPGANVLQTLIQVKKLMADLKDGTLKAKGLTTNQSFDPSVYILNAIALLRDNLLGGIVLAVGLLYFFLRRARATLLIASTMPICMFGTFAVIKLVGHTINVISLAGLAFAVGMVVDAAIVVLENIMRLREEGMAPREASALGTANVMGALLASTVKTIAVFVPFLFMREIEGQIFADLALTISVGVTLSAIAAVTILPVAASLWLRQPNATAQPSGVWSRMSEWVMRLTDDRRRRNLVIGGLMGGSIIVTWALFPSLSYLPPVKRDSVDAFLNLPDGTNLATARTEIGEEINRRVLPFLKGEREPKVKNFYVIGWTGGGDMAVRLYDPSRLDEMQKIVREEILKGFADTKPYVNRGNLFADFGAEANVALQLQSRDASALGEASSKIQAVLGQNLPKTNIWTDSDPDLTTPEITAIPKDGRILETGLTRVDVGNMIRSLGDGLFLSQYFDGDRRKNIVLRTAGVINPEDMANLPVATPRGGIVPFGELVDFHRTVGPSGIFRLNGRRTAIINVQPQEDVALADVVNKIQGELEPQIRQSLPADGTLLYGGSASRLKETIRIMAINFAVALLILFLLMAAMYRSIRDATLVVITIPLATVGGLALLRITGLIAFQPLDLLTMIGFIILLGLVINNAILLVSQARIAEQTGANRREAVKDALKKRLRPIFMSTVTTVTGMMPLLVVPGEGSVIYRGIAAVIIGGLLVSTLFTVILLPALLRVGEGARRRAWRPVTIPAAGKAAA